MFNLLTLLNSMKKPSIVFSTAILAFLLSSYSTYALPGDTVKTALQKFYSNAFLKGLKISVLDINGVQVNHSQFGYLFRFLEKNYHSQGSKSFNGYEFSYSFSTNERRGIVFIESIGYDLSFKYPEIKKFESKNFDPRRDPLVLETIDSAWGKIVKEDFTSSRFTDIFKADIRVIRVYQGSLFAYGISATNCSPDICLSDGLSIAVVLPEYTQGLRIISEYQERL